MRPMRRMRECRRPRIFSRSICPRNLECPRRREVAAPVFPGAHIEKRLEMMIEIADVIVTDRRGDFLDTEHTRNQQLLRFLDSQFAQVTDDARSGLLLE